MLSPPFITNSNKSQYVMLKLIIALIPAILTWGYLYGAGSFIQFILCIMSCYLIESLILVLRKKPLYPFLTDGSAMVTALLLAFCLPPFSPWWLACSASLFAILIGKHVYGGIGQNIFNPAMLGYAIVLLSFPAEFALWQHSTLTHSSMDFSAALETIFISSNALTSSAPTLLSEFRNQPLILDINWLSQPYFYLNLSFLLGGLLLLLFGVITWHIPIGVLLGCIFMTLFIYFLEQPINHLIFHLMSGATMIAAFFIATDPVSAPSSHRAKLYYAVFIGIMIVIIRLFGNFPDGVAFAVLIANLCVPLLDYYLKR